MTVVIIFYMVPLLIVHLSFFIVQKIRMIVVVPFLLGPFILFNTGTSNGLISICYESILVVDFFFSLTFI